FGTNWFASASLPHGRFGQRKFKAKSSRFKIKYGPTQNSKLKTICRCGSAEMALAGGILGRVDDMIIIRGVNIYPGAVEEILRSFSEISQFRIQVAQGQSLAELKVKIETKTKSAAAIALVRRVEKSFRLAFNLRIPVVPVLPGTLPRFEMKSQHWTHK
ncbi:MAG: hypothetical protein ACR2H1_04125, partial [Limisphaerales bacterium]